MIGLLTKVNYLAQTRHSFSHEEMLRSHTLKNYFVAHRDQDGDASGAIVIKVGEAYVFMV